MRISSYLHDNMFIRIVPILCLSYLFTIHVIKSDNDLNDKSNSQLQHSKPITCYKCNSEFDRRCDDPFDPYTLGTVNCSAIPKPSALLEDVPSTICRKTIQIVYGKTRVIRDCGYLTDDHLDKQCLRRSGTHDVRVYYCSCTGDLCNAGISLSLDSILPFLSLLLCLLGISIIFQN